MFPGYFDIKRCPFASSVWPPALLSFTLFLLTPPPHPSVCCHLILISHMLSLTLSFFSLCLCLPSCLSSEYNPSVEACQGRPIENQLVVSVVMLHQKCLCIYHYWHQERLTKVCACVYEHYCMCVFLKMNECVCGRVVLIILIWVILQWGLFWIQSISMDVYLLLHTYNWNSLPKQFMGSLLLLASWVLDATKLANSSWRFSSGSLLIELRKAVHFVALSPKQRWCNLTQLFHKGFIVRRQFF